MVLIMTERFNSGYGGYTCDECNVLLWAGHSGSTNPENRFFCYKAKPHNIVQYNACFYCADCAIKLRITPL